MASTATTTAQSETLQQRSAVPAWMVLPSWLGSLILHALLLSVLLWMWKPSGPRGDFPGDGGDGFRDVGIRLQESGTGEDGGVPAQASSSNEKAEKPVEQVATPKTPQNIELPASVTLPTPTMATPAPIIGIGPPTGLSTQQANQLIQPSSGLGTGLTGTGTGSGSGTGIGGPPGGGGSGTSFLGVGAVGKRFVYVIDRSSSMATDHALQAAKVELLSSIQRLDQTQQFQVIFYNTSVHILDTRGGRFDVFHGIDSHRLKVVEQIRDISPAAGTRHLPAILEGLKFNPDAMFLLTDGAAESALDKRDLEQVQRHNRSGTHIHCIEFGRGEKSPLAESANFLLELSRENQGRYVYRNTRNVLSPQNSPE
ncbi:vWA domain-containing protein [Planctomicrobium sp. SH527]|uniref:vWA domain-containing protein n=1 Tax=Planctomicrobium sp. SH527 TaxID=3448123 RepID=UPI003F5B6802